MSRKRISQIVLFAIVDVIMGACANSPRTLEARNTFGLSVTIRDTGRQMEAEISGLCGHSALGVTHVRVVSRGRVREVIVYIEPAREGMTGNFSVRVRLDAVDRVTFGADKTVIWTRQT